MIRRLVLFKLKEYTKNMLEKNGKIISLSIVIAAVAIAGALVYIDRGSCGKAIPMEAAAEKAIAFINENFLDSSMTAFLKGTSDEGEVYRIHLEIKENESESVLGEFDSYVSKDGGFMFPEGYKMEQSSAQEDNEATTEIPKTDTPDVELFVMSFCPYGNQAEDTMLPVYDLLKDKVDWSIHYIVSADNGTVSSLHGQPEVDQNEREACVLQDSGLDKWWQFATYVNANCGSDGSCWQAAAQNAGLSVSDIENCVSAQGYSLMAQEATVAGEAGVSGSPTLMINGVQSSSVYQYGNPQAYLDAICSAFTSAPQECSQELAVLNDNPPSSGSCE